MIRCHAIITGTIHCLRVRTQGGVVSRVRYWAGSQWGLPRNSWVWAGKGWIWLECRNKLGWRWLSWFERVSFRSEEELSCYLSNLVERAKMKRKNVQESERVKVHANPMPLAADFPNLAEWMTAASFDGEDGGRAAPSITIFCMSGEWRASLKDKEEGLVMWLSAQTADDLLLLAEQMVSAEGAPWRHDEGPREGKRVNGRAGLDKRFRKD
jgi:hypothetical protein